MSRWREQAVIDAPVEDVWELIGDPSRHPERWPVEVSGLPAVTQDATFADVEFGFESDRTSLGLLRAPLAKRFLRRWAEVSIAGLREALGHEDDGKQG